MTSAPDAKAFDLYAAYYDLLYADKDYAREVEYLCGLLADAGVEAAAVLELGCGTGAHAQCLAERGISVHGIDSSANMISLAQGRRERAGAALQQRLTFDMGDVREYRSARRFDAVLSLFHVVSYQTTEADLSATFSTARQHLARGGIFIFDFWYGPAVLSDRPREVTRKAENEQLLVRRSTTPTMLFDDNCVNVHFDIEIIGRRDGRREHFTEDHRMRYLFVPEIRYHLQAADLEMIRAQSWLSHSPLSDRTWYGCVVARAS